MSLLDRIIGRSQPAAPAVARVEPVVSAPALSAGPAAEDGTSGTRRPAGWLADMGWGTQSRVRTLPRVSPTIAQRHATVYACCNVIAGDLSKVGLKLYQRGPKGSARVREHALPYLLNVESSPGVPAIVARYMMVYAFALRGVSYAYAPRDGVGEVELVETIAQDKVSVLRNGRARFYDFEDGAEIQRRAPGRSMVHMRYMAEDGWTGRSPIEVAAESMGLALAGQEAAARAASGVTLKAYIKMADEYEDDEAYRRNQRRIKDALTNPDVEGFPILGKDDSVNPLDLKASDMELLASRRLDREQIASMWRVPPTKLQILEFGVKANAEQAAIDYLTDCLLHWGKQVEEQLGQSLLTEEERRKGLFLRHDFDTLLRPTTKERYEAHARAVGGPFKTANEARREEGLDPVAGGDTLNPAPNMTRKDEAGGKKEEDDE